MFHLGDVPANSTLYLPFDTYDSNGASVTISGLAVTDIEIYKNGSVTQRASDNGYALLDTDGIDFDGATGLHGFSIDLSDNSDAGFYSVGAQYWVNINAITVNAQTVRFTYYFRIVAAESSAGTPKVDVSHWLGTAAATPTVAGVPEVDVTHVGGTVQTAGDIIGDTNDIQSRLPATLNAGRIRAIAEELGTGIISDVTFSTGAFTSGAGNEIADKVWDEARADHTAAGSFGQGVASVQGNVTGSVASVTGNVGGNVVGSVGSISGVTFPTNFASLGINASGHVSRVTLVDTLTTYTGNTPQTGDVYSLLTTAVADSIPADGTRPSPVQALYMLCQGMFEGAISGTTWTIKKVDGSTTLFTVTLDSSTAPTSKTRAT